MKYNHIEVYLTTGDESKKLHKAFALSHKTKTADAVVNIDLSIKKQIIDGFGAAMTESSAYLISQLNEVNQQAVLADLFSPDGIGMSFVRTTIGASDFSLRSFTYDDLNPDETDEKLNQFSLSDDLNYVIPILKKAKTYQDFLMIASPWTAPAWMKDNQSLNGGHLLVKYYPVYANYLMKYIQTYQAQGLEVYAITPQNEPRHESLTYPSMLMSSEEQRAFVKVLGHMFKENQIESKIIAYDHNWDDTNYAKTIYDDIESASFVSGTGFHCYDGDVKATQTLIDQYPSKDIWFTECSGGLWAPNFSDNLGWNIENVFIGSLNHGAKSVLLWNIALDLESGPKNGGCMNCRGLLTIDPITQQIEKNVEYYLVAHFSKFIQRGANVIESNTINKAILNACFLNPDGSVVCVIYNRLDKTQTIHIVIADDVIEYDLKEKSLVTFKLYPNDCNN